MAARIPFRCRSGRWTPPPPGVVRKVTARGIRKAPTSTTRSLRTTAVRCALTAACLIGTGSAATADPAAAVVSVRQVNDRQRLGRANRRRGLPPREGHRCRHPVRWRRLLLHRLDPRRRRPGSPQMADLPQRRTTTGDRGIPGRRRKPGAGRRIDERHLGLEPGHRQTRLLEKRCLLQRLRADIGPDRAGVRPDHRRELGWRAERRKHVGPTQRPTVARQRSFGERRPAARHPLLGLLGGRPAPLLAFLGRIAGAPA